MGKTWDEKEWDRMVDRRLGRPGPAVSLWEQGALFLACVATGFLMVTLPNLDKEGFQPREHVAKQDAEKDAENPDPGAAVGSADLLGGEAASLAVPFSEDAKVAAAKPVTEAPKP